MVERAIGPRSITELYSLSVISICCVCVRARVREMLNHDRVHAQASRHVPAVLAAVALAGLVIRFSSSSNSLAIPPAKMPVGPDVAPVGPYTPAPYPVNLPMVSMGVPGGDDFDEVERNMMWFKLGGRAIDTADTYGNLEHIAAAIKRSGLHRGEFFITAKIEPACTGNLQYLPSVTLWRVKHALKQLGTYYIDLVLMHEPCYGETERSRFANSGTANAWKGLQAALETKLVRSIGVSNFGISSLRYVLSLNGEPPRVNQVQFSIGSHINELAQFCKQNDIILQGMAPYLLGSPHRESVAADSRVAKVLAAHPGVTTAQLILRYIVEKGHPFAVSSAHEGHMREDLAIFDFSLSAAEVAELDKVEIACPTYELCFDNPREHHFYCNASNSAMANCCCRSAPSIPAAVMVPLLKASTATDAGRISRV
jgi:diketogulonate reductase-like aldo/keto reductase